MLKLTAYAESFQTDFRKARAAVFDGIVNEAGFDPDALSGVSWARRLVDHLRANLATLLTGTPEELSQQIQAIETDPDFRQFAAYCALPRRPKTDPMAGLYRLVSALFDYDAMCRDKPNGGYAVVKAQGQRICPYCHMHHLNFHVHADKKKLNLRPPLDHFFPRSVYPYLATSLFNLVPSCEQCNSRIKLARDPRVFQPGTALAHPFDPRTPLTFVSGWQSALPLAQIDTCRDFAFRFAGADDASKAFAEFFKLADRYDWYEHELLDLVKQYRRFLDIDPGFQALIDPVDYMLGFPANEAQKRAVGLVLADAARRIVAARPV